MLSSDKNKKDGTYHHTLGASGAVLPPRYTREQLLRQNEVTNAHLAMAMESLIDRYEYFQSLIYWAEKSVKDRKSWTRVCQKTRTTPPHHRRE
jgi:hypothetical protein